MTKSKKIKTPTEPLSPLAQLMSQYANAPEDVFKKGWEEFKKNNPLP